MAIDAPPHACLVNGNKERLKLAFLNILVNAIEAVEPENGNIRVTIQKSRERFFIDMEDNGCGIPKENIANLFDPYFTSKRNGIGLGLAATLNIIKAHAGEIEVFSEPARKTRFRVILPQITAQTVLHSSGNPAVNRKY